MNLATCARLEFIGACRRRTTLAAIASGFLPPVAATLFDLSQTVTVPTGSRVGLFMTMLILVAPVIAGLLGAGVLARGRRIHFDVIWARGVHPVTLAIVSLVPSVVLVGMVVLGSIGTFALLARTPVTQIADLYGQALTAASPAYILCLAAAVLLGAVLGATASMLLVAVVSVSLATLVPQSLAFPSNVLGLGFYWNQSVGFGPDATLLLARAVFAASVGIAIFMIVPLVIIAVDRRALSGSRPAPTVVTVAIVVPILVSLGYGSFARSAADVVAIPAWEVARPTVGVHTESLSVDVDCQRATISGVARIAVDARTEVLRLALNPGLHVGSVQANPSITRWGQDASGMVELYGVGAAAQVEVHYEGDLKFHRDDYAPALPGLESSAAVQLPIRGYLSRTVCFLLRGGDWYPRELGMGEGADGSAIGDFHLHVLGAGEIVVPNSGGSDLTLRSPARCLFVAFEQPIRAAGLVSSEAIPPEQEDIWRKVNLRLISMHAFPKPRAVLLPIVSEVTPSEDGICAPLAAGNIRGAARLVERTVSDLAARVWVEAALVLDRRPGAKGTKGSTQEVFDRSMPAAPPSFVYAIQSAVADGLEPDLPQLLTLRRQAQGDPRLHQVLGDRGVLGGPTINDAVLGLHAYREISGDEFFGRLLGLIAEADGDAGPSLAGLRSAVARLDSAQQVPLATLISGR